MEHMHLDTAHEVDMFAPVHYVILVQGALENAYSDRLSGMTITVIERPDNPSCTSLTGVLVDQAALHGVLKSLFDLGLPVLAMTSTPLSTLSQDGA